MIFDSKVAVILPLYFGDTPNQFRLALRSLLRQTVSVDIFIIADGPLGKELNDVLTKFKDKFKLIRSRENLGLARALNHAIEKINLFQYDFIARMDADDFSRDCRIYKQIKYMNQHNLDVCGSNYYLFDKSRNRQYIRMPETIDTMKQNIIVMSPLCHPSVVFRSHVLQKERYPITTYFQEDYRFWIKLLKKGYRLGNIPEPLLYFRFSNATQKRRTNLKKLIYDLSDIMS